MENQPITEEDDSGGFSSDTTGERTDAETLSSSVTREDDLTAQLLKQPIVDGCCFQGDSL